MNLSHLLKEALSGNPVAIARAMTILESGTEESVEIQREISPRVGKAHRIGITGPPGVGKSTLVDGLALEARKDGLTAGIIAVDPTSPFTGGALLGDRVRMNKAACDPGIFIRSMASRGSLGGLAGTTSQIADLLDASGKDLILIETVGVGQSELDIFYAVDTVVVVLVPESGGSVQAMKAGLMEIAHLFVVNKADREGATRVKFDIEDLLSLKPPQPTPKLPGHTTGLTECVTGLSEAWEIQVLLTEAHVGKGVRQLFSRIREHLRYLNSSQTFHAHRLEQARKRIQGMVEEMLRRRVWGNGESEDVLLSLAGDVVEGKTDIYEAAKLALRRTGLLREDEEDKKDEKDQDPPGKART